MKNSEFKVGSHILIYGNKGIVEEIEICKEYKISYEGETVGNGISVLNNDAAKRTAERGYTLEETGRTATYFKVSFENENQLKHTSYNGGTYGCVDGYEEYGTW